MVSDSGPLQQDVAHRLGIDPKRLPKHVAVIMDGNGRWAKSRLLPRIAGHRKGAQRVREVVEAAARLKINTLTLFAFSDDNWKRPQAEVHALMLLLNSYLERELEWMKKNGVRLETLGDLTRLPKTTQQLLRDAKQCLRNNNGLRLCLALSYGSRAEIAGACQKIATLCKEGVISEREITSDLISAHLQTSSFPELDLLIRTSGEQRVSNFLLWQLSYAELYFSPAYWPDFSEKDFLNAISEFQNRERRFGAVCEKEAIGSESSNLDLPYQGEAQTLCSGNEY